MAASSKLVEGAVIWDRKADGGFPDVKTLKQRVRDKVDPGMHPSHLDETLR